MATWRLPYGDGELSFDLPDDAAVGVVEPPDPPAGQGAADAVRAALADPVAGRLTVEGAPDLDGVRSVAVAINDPTRPCEHGEVLPVLLDHLESLGVPPGAVTLIVATGTHANPGEDALERLLPLAVRQRCRLEVHDCDAANLVDRGRTSRGTPVLVNRTFAEADLRLAVGHVEPHHFAGYSGGAKTAAIGLAGRATVTANHALLVHDDARLARWPGNPLREDVEEIGRLIGLHSVVAVVPGGHRGVAGAFAGPPEEVMAAAVPVARRATEVTVEAPFDLVLTSPGGAPKDCNLYQAHKALAPALLATRPGGMAVLVARCPDGVGQPAWEAWMRGGDRSLAQSAARFLAGPFFLGPHKALLLAGQASRLSALWVVSDLEPARVRALLLEPATLQAAVDEALARIGPGARVGILPEACATVPLVRREFA